MSKAWWHEGSPLIFLKIATSLNTYNPTNNTQPVHKHIWEICTSEYLKVGQSCKSERCKERKKQRQALWNTAQSSLQFEGKEEIKQRVWLSEAPESCLSDQHITHSGAQWSGQRSSLKGQQLCLSNLHCQKKSWVMETGHLPLPSESEPSTSYCTFPEIAPSPSGICAIRNETYTAASLSDGQRYK